MTGFETGRKIKCHLKTAHVPVLQVSSSSADSHDKAFSSDTEGDGYLVEPIQPQELLATIRTLLRLAAREGENSRLIEQMVEQGRLLNLSNDAIIVRALDNRIVYWNHGAEQMYGWKDDEAIGRNLYDLLGTQFVEPLEDILTQLHRDDRWMGECTQTRRDGVRITVSTRWALDRNAQGRIGSILQTDNDITHRRDAEERVRLSEKLIRRINDVMPAILYVTDLLDTRTVWDNLDIYHALGYSQEDSLRMAGQVLHTLLHPEDWVRYRNHAERLRKLADGAAAEFDYRMRHADGSWRWLHSRDMVFQRRRPSPSFCRRRAGDLRTQACRGGPAPFPRLHSPDHRYRSEFHLYQGS
jgi:PAS domain S-box-containing protein